MIDLLVLGFTLSLDNFRTAVALGGLRLGRRHATQVALAFGFWDGAAPLVGLVIGHYLRARIGSTADDIGAVALGLYGLYLLVHAWFTVAAEQFDQMWTVFSLPLPLSLDNVLAGTSLGLAGFSPWLAPPLFGSITTLMSLVGLQLGRVVARFIRIRPDVLTGVALVGMSVALRLGLVS